MKRIIAAIVLCLILSGISWADTASPPQLQIAGKSVGFNSETGFPYIGDNGRAMMPLRACLSAIGCQVDWNQTEQTASLNKGAVKIEVPVDQKYIYVNQKMIQTDCAAVLKNGRIYLPLRAVMEAFGYIVEWNNETKTVVAEQLTAANINGGTTGIFSRRQLQFEGFNGIEGDVTLPYVTLGEKGDCPYVYFGLDWEDDKGNAEGGFQFIEDAAHAGYNKCAVFMRQGNSWLNGSNEFLEQGSKHHLKLYADNISENRVELVIELDGKEVVRKLSDRADFNKACTKAVISMAMSKVFDGSNCSSQAIGAKLENVKVSTVKTKDYAGFDQYELYHKWNPLAGAHGMSFGTVDCTSDYVHYKEDGSVSIYKDNGQSTVNSI